MKIYKYEVLNMMGYTVEEDYYLERQAAEQRLDEKVSQWKKSKELCKKEDCNYQSRSIVKHKVDQKLTKGLVKEVSVEYWHKTNYEYDEWDTGLEYIRVVEIDVN